MEAEVVVDLMVGGCEGLGEDVGEDGVAEKCEEEVDWRVGDWVPDFAFVGCGEVRGGLDGCGGYC